MENHQFYPSMGRRQSSNAKSDAAIDSSSPKQDSNNLPWGMEKTEMQPSSLAALTDDKLARFVLGHQKKTKFQKINIKQEREDREAKRRQADEEAAKIYATFVASFNDEDDSKGKTFVRSGFQDTVSSTQKSGDLYRLKTQKPSRSIGSTCTGKKILEMDKIMFEIKQKETNQMEHKEQQPRTTQKPKKREIDDFLEEMKERGPAPVSMEGVGTAKGSFDDGNPDTTNLYVGNLAPTVTEEVLEAEFGKYGEINSVKIMWPRSEEERARKRNCGFVSFYERRNADDARINLDNKELDGQPMIVGWGKAVKIQPRERNSGVLPPSSAMPFSVPATPLVSTAKQDSCCKRIITVEIPSGEVKQRVDRLAQYVATDGFQFENAVRMREANNKKYSFLFEPQSATALYYRWRVFSFAMGDDKHTWHEKPFQMTDDGPVWMPPEVPSRGHVKRSYESTSQFSRRSDKSPKSYKYRRNRSKSQSFSRSRSPSSSPRNQRLRRKIPHRPRSSSFSSDDNRIDTRSRRRRSRSRNRGRRSRSSSFEVLGSRKRRRRSCSRSYGHGRRSDGSRHKQNKQNDSRSGRERGFMEVKEKLMTGQQIARARDMERGRERNRLSNEDYDEFKHLLSELTLERESVKRTMGFALDKSEAAVELVYIILESFKSASTSSVTLVGLLYVTSDILHNSSAAVKNASLFRTTFQECLPEIMNTLRVVHKNIIGRMSANAMREKVINVLSAWESWSLFPPAVLLGLHATFLRKVDEDEYLASRGVDVERIEEIDLERLRKTCRQSGIIATGDAKQLVARLQWLKEFTSPATCTDIGQIAAMKKPSTQVIHEATISSEPRGHTNSATGRKVREGEKENGEPIEDNLDGDPIDGEPTDSSRIHEEALDGEPLDGEPLDGEPLDGEPLDGEPLDGEPLDGEPLDGEPLDGEPLDGEPLDGEPLDNELLDEDAGLGAPLKGEDLDGAPIDEDLDGDLI
ncbi:hypothetical protein PsorP6_018256 [Peronosclerospora sorghi]|uniref:Uncharacterized protein n=1 Tax=Peronosclerospora sorghi TaxID=230839 RepID=A0ACC0WE63_9STRA|nr:hypothetical protein PsorP6_018256 [Peronosclerospora sorghi]